MAGAWSGGQPVQVVVEVLAHVPVGGEQEQRRPSSPPSVQAKQPRSSSIPAKHLAAFADADAPGLSARPRTRRRRRRRGRCRRGTPLRIRPDAPVRQAAVRGDVERGEALGVRFGDDQRGVVGVTAMPLGKASSSATTRDRPSGQHVR